MRVPLSLVLLTGSLIGCVDDADNLSEGSHSVVIDNRISLNRISLNRISLNRISLNRISLNRISLNHLEANIGAIGTLLDTPDGQELFSFVISCALGEDTTLVVHHPTLGDMNFPGEVGLAPNWENRPMTGADQRWVSACLLARVNNSGVTVEVSMRGAHDELFSTPGERTTFPREEGAFFGDVFQPDSKPLEMYACQGRDQALGPESGDMGSRDCAEPDAAHPGLTICGMTFAGDCADFVPPANKYACESRNDDGGFYENCTPTASFPADDDDDDHHGHGHGWGWGHHGHGHHHGWGRSSGHHDDDDDDHGRGGHGHGHGCHGHGHGHGHDGDDDGVTDEVITTYVRST